MPASPRRSCADVATYGAVDLGATSGRVVRVTVDGDGLELDLVRRFPNVVGADHTWDIEALIGDVRRGLVDAAARGPLRSLAVDSWGVDFGLLDATGRRLGAVHSYRSPRIAGVMEAAVESVGRARLYALTGIQFLHFNTAFQLVAARDTDEYRAATTLLMVPDLVNAALCGSRTNDVTNASTTQLLDVATRLWSDEVVAALGLRRDLLPELHEPGTVLGSVRGVDARVDGRAVVATASHDTASAVAGVPLRADHPAVYISCGTWSLVGCEVSTAVTTDAALAANVTNELGVDGTVRVLKNVTGLWLLEECRRAWTATDAAELVAAAEDVPGGRCVVDPDDPRLAGPGAMPERIAAVCRATGQPVPESPPEFTRLILDSLALAWRRTVATIERVAGFEADVVHLVGGGAAIPLLRRLAASACGRPLLAGPVEATVVGNALVQAIADGSVPDLAHGRVLVERSLDVVRIEPAATLDWPALATRLP